MAAANVPSMAKARHSAQKIFSIIDEKSNLDVRQASKAPIQDVEKIKGDIQL